MAARHKHVQQAAPRLARLALPLTAATLATVALVGVTVARSSGGESDATEVSAAPITVAPRTPRVVPELSPYLADRDREFSRSAKRVTLERKPAVKDHKFRTANLNLWPAPEESGKPLKILEEGGKVAVTGVRKAGFAEILYGGQVRYVKAEYLADKRPAPATAPATSGASEASSASGGGGITGAPCPDGSSTESGLSSRAVTLYRSACNAFPALSSYGGLDAHGEHSTGNAIDFMVTDPALGQALADWARAHASELGIHDVIWAQHIWTPVRAGEGWRSMSDRGSATANHYDHVHILVA
jgi:hypothetical protein